MGHRTFGSAAAISIALLVVASCGGSTEPRPGPELPTADSWAAENPQPADGEALHLVLDFMVGDDFVGERIDVLVDGEPVVMGWGYADPDAHCNWYGPYVLGLGAGTHDVAVSTGDGLSHTEVLDLASESFLVVSYRHPSFDGDMPGTPSIAAYGGSGTPGCA